MTDRRWSWMGGLNSIYIGNPIPPSKIISYKLKNSLIFIIIDDTKSYPLPRAKMGFFDSGNELVIYGGSSIFESVNYREITFGDMWILNIDILKIIAFAPIIEHTSSTTLQEGIL